MTNFLDKFALPIGIILIIGLVIVAYFMIDKTANKNTSYSTDQITIDVAGAVNNPGVYVFEQNTIIEDAINQAGGITSDADIELISKTINRAALLQNHGKIYIPFAQQDQNVLVLNQTTSNLVNINTSNIQILDTLPGVGPITAERIIDYRKSKGQFKHKDDLMKVEGISISKYEKLKDLITV